ncbi:C2H2 type zinc finger domain protein [Colletotrichum kahawae]|uniref:C2H2 type zinc finger domain protein n=1 Tax=Colletotrichum kahawae TaxID=34407 RepID=A0AAE0DDL9_COLKA|nr:C2H2 type zinc finger domain protein [Colletotrichum kahawae]
MADESRETAPVTDFECSFCRRRFTKKEHLKVRGSEQLLPTNDVPQLNFLSETRKSPCFSRGDVLNRHVKGHKEGAQSQPIQTGVASSASSSSVHPFQSPAGNVALHNVAPEVSQAMHASVVSAADHEGNNHNVTSSSLLWPDSEELFQSLMSADGMTWDQSMPGLIPSAYQPQDVQSAGLSSTADGDELALAEDGHRAVQTINGILTNTAGLGGVLRQNSGSNGAGSR